MWSVSEHPLIKSQEVCFIGSEFLAGKQSAAHSYRLMNSVWKTRDVFMDFPCSISSFSLFKQFFPGDASILLTTYFLAISNDTFTS